MAPVIRRPRSARELRRLLAGRGLRATKQRLAVLAELDASPLPTSHPELTERLAARGIERTTVYRNLLSLTRAGLLVRTQLGDNVWRFELPQTVVGAHGSHPHFICIDCGRVACLPQSAVTVHGETVRSHIEEIQVRGHCAECVDSGGSGGLPNAQRAMS